MQPGQVFVGNIYKFVADGSSVLCKENAVLIKVKDLGFIDLDNLKTILDYFKAYNSYFNNNLSSPMLLNTYTNQKGGLFIDNDSLKPFYPQTKNEGVSLRQIKKDVANYS